MENHVFIATVKSTLAPFKAFIKRPAAGHIPYDYLVPAGPYQEHWDWDAFFMGVAPSLLRFLPRLSIFATGHSITFSTPVPMEK